MSGEKSDLTFVSIVRTPDHTINQGGLTVHLRVEEETPYCTDAKAHLSDDSLREAPQMITDHINGLIEN